jgi:hypothetical protein
MRPGVLCCLLLWPGLASAQTCNPAVAATTPASRFQTQPHGVLLDRHTGLRWQRCSQGQWWDHGHCRGEVRRVTWQQAQTLAGHGWRLPDLKELSAMVELRCVKPAINLALFPDTPAGDFWTATPFVNQPGQQWRVQFIYGEATPDKYRKPAAVRLVRDPD